MVDIVKEKITESISTMAVETSISANPQIKDVQTAVDSTQQFNADCMVIVQKLKRKLYLLLLISWERYSGLDCSLKSININHI
jgi:hypothetical protein